MATTAIGNLERPPALAVTADAERVLFQFTLQGTSASFYNLERVRVQCLTGASDFVVRVYQNDSLIAAFRSDLSDPIAEGDVKVRLVNGGEIVGTVYHFEELSQDFRSTLIGSGSV